MEKADMVIIGSGQGGLPLAEYYAGKDKRVVLFERADWEGSCINYGCTPSKAFLSSAHAAGAARNADRLGIHAEVQVDFQAVMQRIHQMTNSRSDGIHSRLQESGVKTVHAEATFTGRRQVSADGFSMGAPLVVINTGNLLLRPISPGWPITCTSLTKTSRKWKSCRLITPRGCRVYSAAVRNGASPSRGPSPPPWML